MFFVYTKKVSYFLSCMNGWDTRGFPDPCTIMAGTLFTYHELCMVVIVVVIVIVGYFIGVRVFRGYFYDGSYNLYASRNELLEFAWGIAPLLALVPLGVLSLINLYYIEVGDNVDFSVKAIGHQWYWSYEYGFDVDRNLTNEVYREKECLEYFLNEFGKEEDFVFVDLCGIIIVVSLELSEKLEKIVRGRVIDKVTGLIVYADKLSESLDEASREVSFFSPDSPRVRVSGLNDLTNTKSFYATDGAVSRVLALTYPKFEKVGYFYNKIPMVFIPPIHHFEFEKVFGALIHYHKVERAFAAMGSEQSRRIRYSRENYHVDFVTSVGKVICYSIRGFSHSSLIGFLLHPFQKNPDLFLRGIWSLLVDSYITPEDEVVKRGSLSFGNFRNQSVRDACVLKRQVKNEVLVATSDVIHSWGVAELGVKADAVPGRVNALSVTPIYVGEIFGYCYELCGPSHRGMPIVVASLEGPYVNGYLNTKALESEGALEAFAKL